MDKEKITTKRNYLINNDDIYDNTVISADEHLAAAPFQ